MMQASLFDVLHNPAVILPVDADGPVVQCNPDEVLRFAHPRLASDRARIELHRHDNGLWMWSTGWNCNDSGSSYRVGPKWGKFADNRDDALFYAVGELKRALDAKNTAESREILAWAASL